MRYVLARAKQAQEERAYRIYVSDALKGITGANIRYVDLLKPEEKRTPDEIIGSVFSKLGGE